MALYSDLCILEGWQDPNYQFGYSLNPQCWLMLSFRSLFGDTKFLRYTKRQLLLLAHSRQEHLNTLTPGAPKHPHAKSTLTPSRQEHLNTLTPGAPKHPHAKSTLTPSRQEHLNTLTPGAPKHPHARST